MAKRGEEKKKKKLTKQAILELLDGNDIDLSMSDLTTTILPVKELGMIPRGTHLDLSRNQLESLPVSVTDNLLPVTPDAVDAIHPVLREDSFCTLKYLVELDLSKNKLRELPESFGQLVLLQRLDLYSNQLVNLPLGFWQLKKLKWLDLKNNPALEPDLAKAAGTCVDEKECKECAQNVLKYVKHKSAEAERERQRKLAEEKELQRLEEEERMKKAAEVRKQKAELKQRRKEEYARQQAEKAAKEEKEREREQTVEEIDASPSKEENTTDSQSQSCCSCGCAMRLVLSLILLVTFVVLAGALLCNYSYGSQECQRLWAEFIAMVTQGFESLGIKFSNQN